MRQRNFSARANIRALPARRPVCLPTLSTRGYEVIARDAVPAVTRVLAALLRDPAPGQPSRP
jgi:hypothetical protein